MILFWGVLEGAVHQGYSHLSCWLWLGVEHHSPKARSLWHISSSHTPITRVLQPPKTPSPASNTLPRTRETFHIETTVNIFINRNSLYEDILSTVEFTTAVLQRNVGLASQNLKWWWGVPVLDVFSSFEEHLSYFVMVKLHLVRLDIVYKFSYPIYVLF